MCGKRARDLNEAEIRDLALRYLTRREYGVEELARKLRQRGAAADLVESIVSGLADDGLVSDQRFTEMYVRTRIRHLFGPLKIRAELRSRGIADAVIGTVLPAADDAWFDAASDWARKKQRGALDYPQRAKIYRSLVNRGFNHAQANVALDRLNSSD